MEVKPSELMQSVLGKLFEVITQGDGTVTPQSKDNFFSWCSPGIPVTEEDFEFVKYGLTGVVKPPVPTVTTNQPVAEPAGVGADGTAADMNGQPKGEPAQQPSPEQIEQIKASHTGQLYMQAENFARLVDFIPDINEGAGKLSKTSIQFNEGTLSDVYKYALDLSKVAHNELTDAEKAKIAKFRELLQVKRQKKDLITDEVTEVLEPSPLVLAYNQKMSEYIDAALEYNARRVDALTATNAAAVHYFALNGNLLRQKVVAKLNEWIALGYKNEYETINAILDSLQSKDMALLKMEYKDALEKAKLTGIASGSDFYFTSLVPGNFVQGGWTKFTFSSSEYNTFSKKKFTSFGGKAGGGFLSFGAKVSAQHSKQELETSFDASEFALEFEMCQVQIVRPWLKTSFLTSRAWKLDPSNPIVESTGEVLNDGNNPPKGILPGYPTSMLLVRNLKMHFGKAFGQFKSFANATDVNAKISYGPFVSVSGHYSHQNSQSEGSGGKERQGIEIDGMAIIGFNCHVLPKSPDPLPTITNWV